MGIKKYRFSDTDIHLHNPIGERYEFYVHSECIEFDKHDVIMLAKHFKLTAHDIQCTEYKALCADLNLADEQHFDEVVELTANKIKINKRIN